MLSKLIFLMNAAILGGLAGFAAFTVPPVSTDLLPPGAAAIGRSGIATRSVTTQTVTAPNLVRSGTMPGTSAARTANLVASSSSNAIVPPIVRRLPASGSALGPAVAAADLASEKKSAKKAKAEKATAKNAKPESEITGTVKTAAAGARNKQPIDLTGRSALGVAPKGQQGTVPKGVACNAGLKYDAKQLKCVALAGNAAASPRVAKTAAPTPASAVSVKP